MNRKLIKQEAKRKLCGNTSPFCFGPNARKIMGYSALSYLLIMAVALVLAVLSALTGSLGGIFLLPTMIVSMIVGCVIAYGYKKSFYNLANDQNIDRHVFFSGFKRMSRCVFLNLRIMVFTYLWSLLFVIPGIIKTISYSMSWYYLAKDESMTAKEAMEKSKQAMKGHVKDYFLLLLSFAPYLLLYVLTEFVVVALVSIGGVVSFLASILMLCAVLEILFYVMPCMGIAEMLFFSTIDNESNNFNNPQGSYMGIPAAGYPGYGQGQEFANGYRQMQQNYMPQQQCYPPQGQNYTYPGQPYGTYQQQGYGYGLPYNDGSNNYPGMH